MLEILLTLQVKKPSDDYPLSGPGPKSLLFGDTTLGYFGEVSSADLITLADLRTQLNFPTGTDFGSWNGQWIKMYVDQQVIFFPTAKVATNITWNDLYNKGLIYGINGNGAYPSSTPTNQLKVVTAKGSNFKVRCFKACSSDPSGMGGIENLSNTTNPLLLNGEWYRVIASITTPKLTSYTGVYQPIYTQATSILPIGTTPYAWAQETRNQTFVTNGLTINNTQVAPSNVKASALLAWLPVLEVVT